MLNQLKKEKGFTLIEIVLVLAIAGLILVIVFLAVQGAQRSRRDTQRKNDLSRIGSQLEAFAGNSNGVYPTEAEFTSTTSAWTTNYWNSLDPTPPPGPKDPTTGVGYSRVQNLPTCASSPDGTVGYDLVGRIYTIRMCLEQGEQNVTNR